MLSNMTHLSWLHYCFTPRSLVANRFRCFVLFFSAGTCITPWVLCREFGVCCLESQELAHFVWTCWLEVLMRQVLLGTAIWVAADCLRGLFMLCDLFGSWHYCCQYLLARHGNSKQKIVFENGCFSHTIGSTCRCVIYLLLHIVILIWNAFNI